MRIVITSNYKIGNETGTAHISETLSKSLSKKNNVIYICLGDKFEVIKKSKKYKILKIPSIDINNISIPLITPDVIYNLFKYLDEFNPDVIHAQNSLFVCNISQTWANLNNVPFVVTFHHIPTEVFEHLFPKLSKNILSGLVQNLYHHTSLKSYLNKTDCVIALNKFVYKSIRKVDLNIPIKIINNAIDIKNLLNIKRSKKLSKIIKFVFLGSYNERKNQEFLVKTFAKLPANYQLYLYGNKSSNIEYVSKITNLVKKYKLNNVFIKNYSNNITDTYKNSQFLISSSLKEAQSLSIIEALASGIPVIGLKNETISEVINNKNGLAVSQKLISKNFAKRITDYVENINYEEASKQARKSSLKFDIKNTLPEIENLYNSVRCRNSQNSGRNISKYYQEIFKGIIIKKQSGS